MKEDTWRGDWLVRLYQRVRAKGFLSVTGFAEAHLTATTLELAQALADDVAAVQIESALRAEARKAEALCKFARDLLVRCIRDHLPLGWSTDEQFAFRRSGVYADWASGVEIFIDELTYDAIWNSLKQAAPATDWLPESPDDPIIERAFNGVRIDGQAADSQIGIVSGMGRPWPGDWDLVVMGELQTLEQRLGRRLQQEEIMEVVGALMKKYDIDKPFEPLAGATHE